MSKKRYYFFEPIENVNLRHMTEMAKDVLQNIDSMVLKYQKCNDLIHDESPTIISFLTSSHRQFIFSSSPVNSSSSPLHGRVSSSPEKSNSSLTPLKRSTSVSSIPRKYLQFDSANNDASPNITTSPEKQSTPVKIRNPYDHQTNAQKYLSVDNIDYEAIQSTNIREVKQSTAVNIIQIATEQEISTPRKRKKHLTPTKVFENVTESLNFQRQHLPFPHKQVDNMGTLNFEADDPVRQRTVSISPRKIDRAISSEVDQNCVRSIAQSAETAWNLEAEKQKSVEITEKYAIFPVGDKACASPDKEVKSFAVPATGYEKNIRMQDKAKEGNRKSISPIEETCRFANPGKLEENYFSPDKRAKVPIDLTTNVQKYISSGEEAQMVVCSDHDSKLSISPNQGCKVNETFEVKRKSPSPRTIQFKLLPRIIQSARVEVETDVSCELIEKLSPITIPIPLADIKRVTNSKDEQTLPRRGPKDVHLSTDDSKAGSSKDFCSPAKSPLTSSLIVEKTNSRSKDDIISLRKDRLSSEPSKGSPLTKSSLEAVSSPISNDRIYFVMKFNNLLNVREVYLHTFFNNLISFRTELIFLCHFLGNIRYIVQNILLYKDCNSKEHQECIVRLLTVTSKLIEKISSWKMDIDQEIPSWTIYFELTPRIKAFIKTLGPNIQDVTIELLRTYEKDLNAKGKKIDEMIPIANSRWSLFLSTAVDLVLIINLFVKLLITSEILKPSPIPTL